jgi:hypothetical protein
MSKDDEAVVGAAEGAGDAMVDGRLASGFWVDEPGCDSGEGVGAGGVTVETTGEDGCAFCVGAPAGVDEVPKGDGLTAAAGTLFPKGLVGPEEVAEAEAEARPNGEGESDVGEVPIFANGFVTLEGGGANGEEET